MGSFAGILDSVAGVELVAAHMAGLGLRDSAVWSFADGTSLHVQSSAPGELDSVRTAGRYRMIVADVTCVESGVRVTFCGGHPGLEVVTVTASVIAAVVAA